MRISLSQLCDELRKKERELVTDSRKVCEGDIFAAMPPAVPGEPDRSAAHIAMALEKGQCNQKRRSSGDLLRGGRYQ